MISKETKQRYQNLRCRPARTDALSKKTTSTARTSVFVNVSVGAIIIASHETKPILRSATRQVGGAIASLSKVVPEDVNRRDKSYESAP